MLELKWLKDTADFLNKDAFTQDMNSSFELLSNLSEPNFSAITHDSFGTRYVIDRVVGDGERFTGEVDAFTGERIIGKSINSKTKEMYEGSYRNGVRHGEALLTKLDGSGKFTGVFKDGTLHTGTLITPSYVFHGAFHRNSKFSNGTLASLDKSYTFVGEFNEDGQYDGLGKLVFKDMSCDVERDGVGANNVTYIGSYHKGLMSGIGTITIEMEKDGPNYTYSGAWNCDLKDGEGVETLSSGEVFVGAFFMDKRNGYGVMKSPTGMIYEGTWKGDEPSTSPDIVWKISYPDGRFYKGQVSKYLVPDGIGLMRFPPDQTKKKNGISKELVYRGAFRHGIRHGFGVCTYYKGERYEGQWFADEPVELCGVSTAASIPCTNLDKYVGALDEAGDRQGVGCHVQYIGGSFYQGEWENSIRHGYGILVTSCLSYCGHFDRGCMTGLGTMCLPDDTIISGNFVDGFLDGYGVLYTSDSSCSSGIWKQGILFTNEKFESSQDSKEVTSNLLCKTDLEIFGGMFKDVIRPNWIVSHKKEVGHKQSLKERLRCFEPGNKFLGPRDDMFFCGMQR